jgi:type IV pilus assembly protein PilY1
MKPYSERSMFVRNLGPKSLFGTSLASVVVSLAFTADAQSDIDRPLANVLLLVDSSGSMEFRAADNKLPVCNPGNPGATNEKSRWIDLVEVMTGTLNNYSCFPMSRSSSAFASEYGISGKSPYDWNYVNPFNRIVSGGCTVGPGVIPPTNAPYSYPTNTVGRFTFTAPSTVVRPASFAAYVPCPGFSQGSDGILDVFKEKVRFGLMTFDTHVDAGTGLTSSKNMDVTTGFAGTWSYFQNSVPATGRPANCSTDQPQEVGARNAAAPPWEGRMVAFGASDSPSSDLLTRNQRIQEVFLSTRPYGATPLAGQLSDARDFLWKDTSKDPLDASASPADFGPKADPLTLLPECRRSIIILLSDGEPNLDLRPFCENTAEGGHCPYETPEDIAWNLRTNPANDPDQSVETVVIGFALSQVTVPGKGTVSCDKLTTSDCSSYPNERALQACCTLNAIAAAGGKPNSDGSSKTAYFPKNNKELRQTFSRILSGITTSVTTRTSAVFASASQGNANGSNQFSSGFEPVLEQPWRGKLTRKRIQCNALGVPEEQAVDGNQGDDFARNVSSGSGSARQFITFVPDSTPANTVRPYVSGNPDGLNNQTGTKVGPTGVDSFVSSVPAAKMNVTAASCTAANATTCRNDILGWLLGKTNSEGETRCSSSTSSDCSLFGAIFYANPTFVSGAPREYLQDETYAGFARAIGVKKRSNVLYAPTVDGMLHAMKTAPYDASGTAVDSATNNELWAFIPPAVLPVIQSQYPNTPAVLLDGTPVVRDVPARLSGSNYLFERPKTEAKTATGTYRTAMVSGFGVGQVAGGYYALDVTDPDLASGGGPKFLWQLTKDTSGNALFGEGGTAALATVFVRANSSDPGADVAVAILPGGDMGLRTGVGTTAGPILAPKDTTYAAKTSVSSYTSADAARSLTVVRLDTGEILRSFRAVGLAALSSTKTTLLDIPAPISGRPAVYPGTTGTNADRAFVGDNEGRLWRLDLSNPDPSLWTFQVYFDAYFDQAISARQPIELAPVLSVDDQGIPAVVFATGEQRVQTATAGMLNRIISVSDYFNKTTAKFSADVNWVQSLGCPGACAAGQYSGERVTGPMELFGGTVYASSGIPATAGSNQCTQANHRIWALDYVKSEDERLAVASPNAMSGPAGRWPAASSGQTPPKSTSVSAGLVYGVAIEQQPSCSTEVATPTDDPYLAYGTYTSTSTVTPGNFFLVYQVGGVNGNTTGEVTTNKVQLQAPPSTVNIDSWAPLFE